MKIAMLSTGDEVLQGDIVDTNASWFSSLLTENGLKTAWRATVADDLGDLASAFELASQRADVVVVNGGLGPTSDDLSAEAAAKALGEELVEFEEWTAKLKDRYQSRNRTMPLSNLKQSMLPASATLIDNPIGSACGFCIRLNDAVFYFTPGVPSEFKRMVHEQILPALNAARDASVPTLLRWHTFGLSESRISDHLHQIAVPPGAVLGYRSALPGIEIKLRLDRPMEPAKQAELAQAIEAKLADHLVCRGKGNMAAVVQSLMLERGARLALAESCTGGQIASELVAISGSSGYLDRGFVTYSNQAKQQELGVPADLIEQHGAVSDAVARAMAAGAQRAANSEFALATSGIAGPEGGSEEKPVGTVAFALATPDGIYSQLLMIPNRGREFIRHISALLALDMLRRYLSDKPVIANFEYVKRLSSHQPE